MPPGPERGARGIAVAVSTGAAGCATTTLAVSLAGLGMRERKDKIFSAVQHRGQAQPVRNVWAVSAPTGMAVQNGWWGLPQGQVGGVDASALGTFSLGTVFAHCVVLVLPVPERWAQLQKHRHPDGVRDVSHRISDVKCAGHNTRACGDGLSTAGGPSQGSKSIGSSGGPAPRARQVAHGQPLVGRATVSLRSVRRSCAKTGSSAVVSAHSCRHSGHLAKCKRDESPVLWKCANTWARGGWRTRHAVWKRCGTCPHPGQAVVGPDCKGDKQIVHTSSPGGVCPPAGSALAFPLVTWTPSV